MGQRKSTSRSPREAGQRAGGRERGSSTAAEAAPGDAAARPAVVECHDEVLPGSEQHLRLLYEHAPLGYQALDADGRLLEVNPAWQQLLGYERKDVIGRWFGDFLTPAGRELFRERFVQFKAAGETRGVEFDMVRKDGATVVVSVDGRTARDAQGAFLRTHCMLHDVTERRRLDVEREETIELLRRVNEGSDLRGLMRNLTLWFQQITGCQAVGVRLRDGGDFPYYETRGFPAKFVLAEDRLCAVDQAGELVRDSSGDPVMECMCGNVLCGRFDPAKPFFTPRGSFWSSSTSELLASTTEADRQARTRNRCNGEGYESVALLPLRCGGETFGLFQFNDGCRGRFTAERVAHLERLVECVAAGLAHRRSTDALRRREAQYRRLLDNISDALIVDDVDGRVVYANDRFLEIFGFARDDLATLRLDDCVASGCRARLRGYHDRRVRGEDAPRCFEYEGQRKDGSTLWLEASVTRIEENGRVVGTQSLIQDITDRKRVEGALRESQGELKAVYDGTPVMMCVLDAERHVVSANRAFIEASGWPNTELNSDRAGGALGCVFSLDDPRGCGHGSRCQSCGLRLALTDTVQNGTAHSNIEYQTVLQRQGRREEVVLLGSTIRVGSARQNRTLLSLLDITARQRAEEALRLNESRLNEAQATGQVGSFRYEFKTDTIWWSDEMYRLFGLDPAKGPPRFADIERMIHPDDLERWRSYRPAALAAGASVVMENRIVRPDGTIRHHSVVSRVRVSGDGEPLEITGTVRDVTERKLAEEGVCEQHKLMDYVIRHDPNAIAVYDRELRYVFVSERYLRDYNVQRQDVIGKHHYEVFPEMPQRWKDVHQRVLGGAIERSDDDSFERPDGSVTYNRWECRPWYRGDGEIGGMITYTEVTTERKRAEEALRESERFARSTLDGLSAHIAIVNEAGVIEAVNQAWRDFAGDNGLVDGNVCEGARYLETCEKAAGEHAEGAAEFGGAVREVLAGQRQHFELEYPCHSREEQRWFVARVTRFPGEGPARAVIAHENITARRQAEQALRESETRFRAIVVASRDAIVVADDEGRYVAANPAAARAYGLPADQLIGRRIDEFLERDYDFAGVWAAFKQRGHFEGEHHLVRADGVVRDAESYGVANFLPGRHLSVIRDITDRKRNEEMRTRLAAAVEQAAEVIVITDAMGAIQYVNPAFERVTGYVRGEVLGENPRLLKSGSQSSAFYRELWATITSGRPWTGRFTNRRKDGTLYQEEATISPVVDSSGKLANFVAVKRDITQELAVAEQLRQAQKMEAVGQLAAGVAHDFNNLLTALLGYVDLTRQAVGPEHPVLDLLQDMEAVVRQATGVTRGLLTFSGRAATHKEVLDLREVLRAASRLLRHLLPSAIELDVQIPAEVALWVYADPTQLQQVLMNLAVNARDAMPEGGRLRVAVDVGRADGGDAPGAAGESGNTVQIEVSDTGVGMSADVQARIFEPFFTTHAARLGTGLGLAIIRSIVQEHGGSVEVTSAPGAGSTFRVRLPGATAAAIAEVAARTGAVPRGQGELVLLAEDSQYVRDVIATALEESGYVVCRVADGVELWERYQAMRGPLGLLVVDVDLPKRGGLECLAAIRAGGDQTPAIVITGRSEVQVSVLGPADVLLRKPFPLTELVRCAAQVIAALPPKERST